MSDKETAPWIKKVAKEVAARRVAAECTAADEIVKGLSLRGIQYCAELAEEGTPWESVAEPEPQYFATFLEAYDFQIELAATPQVTPELPLEQLKEIVETPIEDEWDTSEQASPTPDNCPKCKSRIKTLPGVDQCERKEFWHECTDAPPCPDSWHVGEVERG